MPQQIDPFVTCMFMIKEAGWSTHQPSDFEHDFYMLKPLDIGIDFR